MAANFLADDMAEYRVIAGSCKATPAHIMTSQAEKARTLIKYTGPGRVIWIALGSNIPGTWGFPEVSILRAICEIEKLPMHLVARSPLYSTEPLGNVRQPRYLNMVIGVRGSLGPSTLLRALKRLEAAAGRRRRVERGPRPLDLDILDHAGRIVGGSSARRIDGRLILPHPELHKRGFVLVPLAAVAPTWRHPRLGVGVRQLLARYPTLARGIRRLRAPADARLRERPPSVSR